MFTEAGVECVSIPIVNDGRLEDEEMFSVVLTTRDDAIDLGNNVAQVHIIDSQGM